MDGADREPPDHLTAWFWEVVASGHGDPGRMRAVLETMDVPDLLRFHHELEDAVAELQGEPFDRYLTKDSEDGAMDVAYWVVSQGRDHYHVVFEHPETIPEHVEQHPPGVLHDGVTLSVFHERTGGYPPDRG